MKYFIDTEFIEKPNTISLISIGIVCEDGREYYALNRDANIDEIWEEEWIRENVLRSIYDEYIKDNMKKYNDFTKATLQNIFKFFGKNLKNLNKEIQKFVYYPQPDQKEKIKDIQFYAYYADYDWVIFCWIFGRMIDLPENFPKYCIDVKQMMDERGLDSIWKDEKHPDPEGEHNALVDAKWTFELHEKVIKY